MQVRTTQEALPRHPPHRHRPTSTVTGRPREARAMSAWNGKRLQRVLLGTSSSDVHTRFLKKETKELTIPVWIFPFFSQNVTYFHYIKQCNKMSSFLHED